ncbi:MAG: leucine-rich repeat domain-containing protein [Promethearchaeota archaeon]
MMIITENDLLEKFKRIIKMSQEVSQDVVAKFLRLTPDELFGYLVDWVEIIPFKIKGNLIVVEDINDFMKALDLKYNKWSKSQFICFEVPEKEEFTTFEDLFGMTYSGNGKNAPIPESKTEFDKDKFIDESKTSFEENEGDSSQILIDLEDKLLDFVVKEEEPHVVDLENSNLEFFPKSIFTDHQDIKELYLTDNKIQQIPHRISELSQLEILELESNQIIQLPSELQNVITIKELNLNNNKISYLPPWIGKLTNLRFLHCDKNQIDEIPETLGNLTNLKELHLDYNYLPKDIENNPIIQKLKKQGCWVKTTVQLDKFAFHKKKLTMNKILKKIPQDHWIDIKSIYASSKITDFAGAQLAHTYLIDLTEQNKIEMIMKKGRKLWKRI